MNITILSRSKRRQAELLWLRGPVACSGHPVQMGPLASPFLQEELQVLPAQEHNCKVLSGIVQT